jgi:hemolysin activation/secretion protein
MTRLSLLLVSTAMLVGPIAAQTVERHPAQILQGPQLRTLSAALLADRPDDPTPFGIDLGGLLVVDGHANGGKLLSESVAGVDTRFGGPTAQNDALRKALAKYVGQPLSFRLLSAIQADITRFYRDNGRSLVSVTVPQQEITGGTVQINVTSFVLAATNIEGADAATAAHLTRQLRLRPGQEVDTDRLLEDVNWLNQNPFRHVSVVFEPGQARDSTNLTLQVQSGRTWSAYTGISNAGSEDTGLFRLYAGVNISALPWKDQQFSYQITASPDVLSRFELWDVGTEKGYLSHAVSYFIPITTQSGFRTKLTFGASHISSYSDPGGFFTSGTETNVLNGEISFPLPKTHGRIALVPELYFQVEQNDYDKLTYFFGIPLTGNEENTRLVHGVIGLRAGMSGALFERNARGSLDLSYLFGQQETGELGPQDYSAFKLTVKQEIFLEGDRSLAFRFAGQSSPDDLHELEQLALGGDSTVRGYPVNDVSGNTAFSASMEYRMTPVPLRLGTAEATLGPYLFADAGFADATSPLDDEHLAAIGIGGAFEVGANVVGAINFAQTLQAAGDTGAHETSVAFQLTARF